LGRTGPSSLERAASRLSESNDEGLVLFRLKLAPSSLKRTGYLHWVWHTSLERRACRLSETKHERITLVRLLFA